MYLKISLFETIKMTIVIVYHTNKISRSKAIKRFNNALEAESCNFCYHFDSGLIRDIYSNKAIHLSDKFILLGLVARNSSGD